MPKTKPEKSRETVPLKFILTSQRKKMIQLNLFHKEDSLTHLHPTVRHRGKRVIVQMQMSSLVVTPALPHLLSYVIALCSTILANSISCKRIAPLPPVAGFSTIGT